MLQRRLRSLARLAFPAVALLVLAASCGGKVIFDASAGGSTGAHPPTCLSAVCDTSGTSCSCNGTCFGKMVEETCAAGPTGPSCQCLIAGAPVGTCSEPAMSAACDVKVGCCRMFWPS